MDGKQDYDVLGFIYEYLISNFAANAGKRPGVLHSARGVAADVGDRGQSPQKQGKN